jgi:Arc/MetJ-type ribon-helix-helix transcriptional regulator
MTINLPKDVENSINAEVLNGQFASADDAIAEAWRAFLRQRRQAHVDAKETAAGQEKTAARQKPIWEVFQEISASVPDEVWDALPTDLSEQHDHYVYGTPKRPVE